MRTIIALFCIAAIAIGVYLLATKDTAHPDDITKRLCREYADRDHEKELAPERWQWFIDRGINPNTDFDWYQSCIDHNTKAVAD